MIKGVLLDLSGVLYLGDIPFPGAIPAVQRLSESGLTIRYITNTTRKPRTSILERLARMGFKIEAEDIFTAPIAAKQYLKTNNFIPYLVIHPDLEVEFADMKGEPNAVLIGDAADGFSYDNLNKAFRLLLDEVPLLAMGINRYFKEGEQFSLDAGPFVQALEYASGCKATVIGKPAREFYMSAVESLGCNPKETMMVGDDVESDVVGAVDAGLQGILVKTGKYREGDEKLIENKASCVADINEAVDLILKNV